MAGAPGGELGYLGRSGVPGGRAGEPGGELGRLGASGPRATSGLVS